MRQTLAASLFALTAAAACAQGFYYQSTMPDGRVVIGDKPAPGAKDVKQIPLRSGNLSAPLATPPPALREGQRGRREQSSSPTPPSRSQPSSAPADNAQSEAAQQALKEAKAALEAGQEPLEGERIGTAGGKSRLNDSYFQRIQGLQDAVTAAQQRVDKASASSQ